jgi:glycolate oxidase
MRLQQATQTQFRLVSVRGTPPGFRASFDGSKLSFMPAAVVRPRTRSRHHHGAHAWPIGTGVPVTVRGGGNLADGVRLAAARRLGARPVGLEDASALMRRRARSRRRPGSWWRTCSAPWRQQGWFYPPDPASKQYCTVGGNIACNAGGMHGGKYGVTRDFVLALRGFLPTGEYVEWGSGTKKFCRRFQPPGPLDRQRRHVGRCDRGDAETHPAASGALDAPDGVCR